MIDDEWLDHMDLHLTEHDERHAGLALRAAWPHVRAHLADMTNERNTWRELAKNAEARISAPSEIAPTRDAVLEQAAHLGDLMIARMKGRRERLEIIVIEEYRDAILSLKSNNAAGQGKGLAEAGRSERADGALTPMIPAAPDERAALQYLLDSTAPDGQWADQAVHGFVKTLLDNMPPKLGAFCPVDTHCKETTVCVWPCKRLKPSERKCE